ncbi:PREDICTED: uncharacterized protein LOC108564456 [Nicrophorus vespilloides]|uniref:Uncharacterized protein LOC108564456 n=1 Tax=Nicrophorus vespilloides TaxID=110193 RepID=A0ABM1MWT0_NICVS|nr:PREDICTED: uncharacterized protein LOC108564456 [Nicrophorus vespilloides]
MARTSNVILIILVVIVVKTWAIPEPLKIVKKLYEDCSKTADLMKCLKIRSIIIAEKALKMKKLELFDGVTIVEQPNNRSARFFFEANRNLRKLHHPDLNKVLLNIAADFIFSRSINFDFSKIADEARRRKKDKLTGPFLAAIAIKGTIMSMAYKTIAAMAGTALIIGKMALAIAAILGLKKLVSGGKEKTTFEIVKHPTYSSSHTHSSSLEESEGHYHRSFATTAEHMLFLEQIAAQIF